MYNLKNNAPRGHGTFQKFNIKSAYFHFKKVTVKSSYRRDTVTDIFLLRAHIELSKIFNNYFRICGFISGGSVIS
jgi:hypothetical protein